MAASNTLVIGETRLIPSLYDWGEWHDDRGWSDGWDPDTLRSTICELGQDREIASNEVSAAGYRFATASRTFMEEGPGMSPTMCWRMSKREWAASATWDTPWASSKRSMNSHLRS
jgi:hypothetical protein